MRLIVPEQYDMEIVSNFTSHSYEYEDEDYYNELHEQIYDTVNAPTTLASTVTTSANSAAKNILLCGKISKATPTTLGMDYDEPTSQLKIFCEQSVDNFFENIIKNVDKYKCDLINTNYDNIDYEISQASYECDLINDNSDNRNDDNCTIFSNIKIYVNNVINPISEFLLNLPKNLITKYLG